MSAPGNTHDPAVFGGGGITESGLFIPYAMIAMSGELIRRLIAAEAGEVT
jgi:hypothetical protein